METEVLTIRQVAKQTGVPSKTLRYWESEGLLAKPSRNYNGYRLYKTAVVQRITFIQKAKSVGLTLAEIRKLFDLAKTKGTACPEVVKWTGQKIQALERQIELLSQLRDRLINYQKEWEKKLSCPPLSIIEVCCLIEALPLSPSSKGGEAHAVSHKPLTRYVGRHARQSLARARESG